MLKEPGPKENVRKEFARTGTTMALDGSEDCLLDSKLARFWTKEGICEIDGHPASMPEWRKHYVTSIENGGIKKAENVMELIQSLENPHDGPGSREPPPCEDWGDFEDDMEYAPEDILRTRESMEILSAKYAAKRTETDPSTEKERESEREARRQKLIEEAEQVVRSLPRVEDSAESKRAFSKALAEMVIKIDVSPRHKKAEAGYLTMRNKQEPDYGKKSEMLRNYDAQNKANEAEIEAEQRAHEEKMAEIRASALKKERGRQPKKNPLTEEEKKERSRKYAKAALGRKKAGKSKKAAEADAGSWQIVEVREWGGLYCGDGHGAAGQRQELVGN